MSMMGPNQKKLDLWLEKNRPDLWLSIQHVPMQKVAIILAREAGISISPHAEVEPSCSNLLEAFKAASVLTDERN